MKLQYWICTLLLTLGIGCKTIVDTPTGYDGDQITFGNGGGFTGAVTSYTLLANGQIFVSKGMEADQWAQHSTISKKAASALLKKCATLGLQSLDHNHPGNTYKFIKRYTDQKENYISWGASEHPIDKEISDFYFDLMKTIKG